MKRAKIIGSLGTAIAAALMLAAPASARPWHRYHHHRWRVCHAEWHHGHRMRVCRWR